MSNNTAAEEDPFANVLQNYFEVMDDIESKLKTQGDKIWFESFKAANTRYRQDFPTSWASLWTSNSFSDFKNNAQARIIMLQERIREREEEERKN